MSDARRRIDPCRCLSASHDILERLEPRVMFAGNVFDISRIPVYRPTTTDIHDEKHGPMAVAGGDLIDVYLDSRRAQAAGQSFDARTAQSAKGLLVSESGKIGVTLRTRGDFNWFAKKLVSTWGFETLTKDKATSTITGYLPAAQLRTLAVRTDVAQMTPIYAPHLHRGSANNQGDAAQRSNIARTTYGLTGAGVKVGVLSDSANAADGGLADSQATGDLPSTVQDLRDVSNGSDEGRAMLEEIYDIAPGASLAFATANGGQSAFASAITLLRTSGANVMVDDIGYPDEPMYQPGVIDTAIKTFTQAGGIYASAVGNSGDSGWEEAANFFDVVVPTPQDPNNTETFIDWDPAAGTTARRMTITTSEDGNISLGWDNPWNGVIGAADVDLDIRFFRTGTNTVVAQGTTNNLVTGRPMEIVQNLRAGTYDVEIQLDDMDTSADLPTMFKLTGEVGITSTQFTGATRAAAFGHAAGPNVISVAAVNFFDAPPVDNTPPILTADYTSTGPVTHLFDANGNRLSSKSTLQKPDVTAADGVNTSFFGDDDPRDTDTLPNFFGTSAAAPNVAAGIALLKQVNPKLTQASALSALKTTARPVNGAAAGVWNPSGGFGLVDINASVPLIAVAPTVDIIDVTPDPITTAVDTITIKFDQQVTGFSRGDLRLTLNGGSSNLLTSAQTLTTTDNITFTLTNLAPRTGADGTYTLTLTASGSGVQNLANQDLAANATESWTKVTPPPPPAAPTGLHVDAVGSSSISLSWRDPSSNETKFTVVRATDSSFTRDNKTINLPANTTSYTDRNLQDGTRYYYRVRASNVSGPGRYSSSVSAATLVQNEVIVDSDSRYARVSGPWETDNFGSGFDGGSYLRLDESDPSSSYVRYVPSLTGNGPYFIYARWPRLASNATNAQFEIFFGPDVEGQPLQHQIVLMDQRHRGGSGWVLVGGPYEMNRGTGAGVRIRNTGADGDVIADSIRFLPAGPLKTPDDLAQSGSTKAFRPAGSDDNASNPFSTAGAFGSDKSNRDDLTIDQLA